MVTPTQSFTVLVDKRMIRIEDVKTSSSFLMMYLLFYRCTESNPLKDPTLFAIFRSILERLLPANRQWCCFCLSWCLGAIRSVDGTRQSSSLDMDNGNGHREECWGSLSLCDAVRGVRKKADERKEQIVFLLILTFSHIHAHIWDYFLWYL